MSRKSVFSGVAGIALSAAAAFWTAAGLIPHAASAIPGNHLGDNAAALWNVWWFTYAVEHGSNVFRTAMLFAPFGTQLSLHTHATTHSLLAFPVAAWSSVAAGHNAALVLGLALNGFCTFLLARRVLAATAPSTDGPLMPALTAGGMFALSAFVQSRVLGHINLLHAWVLPLFALALLRVERLPRPANAALLGLAAAIVVYTDYYYAVYALIVAALWTFQPLTAVGLERRPAVRPRLRLVVLALILIDVLVIVAIARTGAESFAFGGLNVSIRSLRNPLTVLWALIAVWAFYRFPIRLSATFVPERRSFLTPRLALTATGALLLATAPLAAALVNVIWNGDYAAPRIGWRTSPAGADLLTLVIGHPRHLLTGAWTGSVYDAEGIDMMEQSLWLGLVPCAFLLMTYRGWRLAPAARRWLLVGGVFFVLALGPFLRVAGADTSLPLPFSVLRYLPGFSNARIPGRAVVMVNLAIAVLTAVAMAQHGWRRRWQPAALAALILLETLPSPAPVRSIPARDAVDRRIASGSDPGGVAELPLGLRDGFGETGRLDHGALVHQMWHEHPLAGGFVARLSPRLKAEITATPLMANYLALSTAGSGDRLAADAAASARSLGIPYLVVNRDALPPHQPSRAELEAAGFQLVERAGTRELYLAKPAVPPQR